MGKITWLNDDDFFIAEMKQKGKNELQAERIMTKQKNGPGFFSRSVLLKWWAILGLNQ